MDTNAINGLQQSAAVARPSNPVNTPSALGVQKPAAATAEQPVSASPASEQDRKPLEEAISGIKQFAQSIQRNLDFALDDSSGRMVVKVTDSVSGDVIRQIPSEDALRLAESLEEARSLLFKAEA